MSLSISSSEAPPGPAYYLCLLALAVLLPASAAAVLNYLLDPLKLFNPPAVQGMNTVKTELFDSLHRVKPVWAAHQDWDLLVLGTSRAGGGLPEDHQLLADRSFNFALPGARFTTSAELYRLLSQQYAISEVLLTLDFFSFNTSQSLVQIRDAELLEGLGTVSDVGQLNWQPVARLNQRLDALLSWQGLQQSLRSWNKQADALAGVVSYFEYSNRGFWRQQLNDNSQQSRNFRQIEDQYLQRGWFPPPRRVFSYGSGHDSSWYAYAALLRLLHADGVRSRLVISPLHQRFLLALRAAGLEPVFADWKRELLRINEETAVELGLQPFPLWDFADASAPSDEEIPVGTGRMRYFIDGQHYRPALGAMLLDRLADIDQTGEFGTLLSGNTIDASLQRTQERLNSYLQSTADAFQRQTQMQQTAQSWGGRFLAPNQAL